MRKKKILYGLEASCGGALKHLTYLVQHIDKRKFDITVVLSNSRKDCDEQLVGQLQATGVSILKIPMNREIGLVNDFAMFRLLYRHIKMLKYDIVHAHSSKAGGLFRLAAWFNKTPLIIYTPHCFYFQSKQGIKRRLYIQLERWLGGLCHKVVVSNHEKRVALIHRVVGVPKLININNAINFNEYQQYKDIQKIKDQWGIPHKHFLVGAVGRLVPQKDWPTFIQAALLVLQSRKDVSFIIAGNGYLENELSKLIMKHKIGSNVKLLGFIPDISKVYSIIDLFVSTSLWEGLPYAYLEAGFFSKPVVATGTLDHAPLEVDFGFTTVPVKKHERIAEKILQLIDDHQNKETLGKLTFKCVTQKYSFSNFIKEHELLYHRGC